MKGRVFEFPPNLWSFEIEHKGQLLYSFDPKRPTGFVEKAYAERCMAARMEIIRRQENPIQDE